jgi:plastocyanin
MRHLTAPAGSLLAILALVLAGGCGSGDDTGPGETRPVLAKTATKSGDEQNGILGQVLPNALRVVVTRDGVAAPGIPVAWATASGTMSPGVDETDEEGVSTSTWTVGTVPGTVSATATVTNAAGSPATFTATITDGGGEDVIVQVLTEGGTRFSPQEVSIPVGTTVTWVWGTNAAGHNVVPDAGDTPASSGAPASAPHSYSFTFDTPGVYSYHCTTHAGMTGTVTVAGGQS